LFDPAPVPLPVGFEDKLDREFLIRFLYSCLVDADGLDTAAHRWGLQAARVAPATDLAQLWDRFTRRRAELIAQRAASSVDRWREEVYQSAVAAAEGPTGIYRLPAPTGSGKTLASAAFALRHAALHGRRRIVVAVPFLTVTEQNAAVLRRLLDPASPHEQPVVLEHHSNVQMDSDRPEWRWHRLAAENWDAPFVVTTTVQLFESLFGRRPAQMRKVHRLANAVLVLDEVQALPHQLLPVIADALRAFAQRFNTTVLLSSATQPELWDFTTMKDIEPRDVIADPKPLYAALRRVKYTWWPEPQPTLDEVAREAAAQRQALVVVNTIADARAMHEHLSRHTPDGAAVRHLSTAMCALHRRDVLDEVNQLLATDQSIYLVSTQLIEAGVDIDFPVVYRALAPADSLQQAAGRANREGHLGPDGGQVIIFAPADGGQPSDYKTRVGITRNYFGPGKPDPDDLDSLREYYPDLYRTLRLEDPNNRAGIIQKNRAAYEFRAVTEGPLVDAGKNTRNPKAAFKMIDQETAPVAVQYGAASERVAQLAAELRDNPAPDAATFREIQPYLASISTRRLAEPAVNALWQPVIGNLVLWRGDYDQAGLVIEPRADSYLA